MSGPRYSIIRGDFPSDPRAELPHFRVYTLIGRHTDTDGWCRLKQITIAYEIGYSRKTVNLAIADLVAWGYVEKRATDATGRAIWYRTIMDAPAPPPAASDDEETDCETGSGPVTSTLQVAPTCNLQEVTPGVTIRGNTERPLLNDSYPLPRGAGGATGDQDSNLDLSSKAASLLAEVRAAGASADVVEHLLKPILERRRFSAGDKIGELVRLAAAAKGLSDTSLGKAAQLVLDSDVQTVKPQRIADAVEKARRLGAMVVIRLGTPQWQRWLEHFQAADPRQAAVMRNQPSWQVPTEWPPGNPQAIGRGS